MCSLNQPKGVLVFLDCWLQIHTSMTVASVLVYRLHTKYSNVNTYHLPL